uniref:Uncharacterized protein n=1 Tax=Lepeophtheirus salmonis TaxID=72036 RepID=A0A0K2URR0_LEPSM
MVFLYQKELHLILKVIRLPSHWNREVVYNNYTESCFDQGYDKYCSISTFICHWKTACPELGIMGRRSNVCHICYDSQEFALLFRESMQ